MIDFGSDESFIENYKRLKSSRKMGELYKCDKTSVLNHAKKIGYNTKGNKEIKLSQENKEEIIANYEKLKSSRKVAEIYNCSSTAVLNFLKKNNIQTYEHGVFSSIPEEEFIANYEELKSAQSMGELYGCSSTAVLNYAKKIGYHTSLKKNYKLSDEDKNFIIEHYEDMTSGELAEKFNVSRGMITKLWFDNNLNGKPKILTKTTEIDMTGQTIGYWTVLSKSELRNSGGVIYWHCKCSCGTERDVLGTSLRNRTSLSCGCKQFSKGNEKIKKLLSEAGINFEQEKKFLTCKDKKELPFDFYVNNQYLIEYDGSQHYDENTIFNYEYTHQHDLMKSKWCKDNNIPLIRIPYTHYNDLKLEDLKLETTKFLE